MSKVFEDIKSNVQCGKMDEAFFMLVDVAKATGVDDDSLREASNVRRSGGLYKSYGNLLCGILEVCNGDEAAVDALIEIQSLSPRSKEGLVLCKLADLLQGLGNK